MRRPDRVHATGTKAAGMSAVHIITPIISEGFRDEAPLAAAVPAGCRISSTMLERGPASVESAVDEVLAGPGVIDAALRAEAEGADALVIDCMLDPALEAAREAVSIPVIGCGEAAMTAAAAAGPFAIVTVLARQEPAFRALAARYGLADGLVCVRGIGMPVLALEREAEAAVAATVREARQAVDRDGARTVVFGCTGMLGFGASVAAALDGAAEVIDPLPFAVARAHAAATVGAGAAGTSHPAPEPKRIAGFEGWPALVALMEGRPWRR